MFDRQLFLARFRLQNVLRSHIGRRFVGRAREAGRAQWDSIHSRHGGKRPWLIVGNGPSLKTTDLEALAGLPSIASNKINLLYDTTSWRPTLYTIADPLLLFKLSSQYYHDFGQVITPDTTYYLCKAENKVPFRYLYTKVYDRWKAALDGPAHPIDDGIMDGSTITTCNIQIALWLGATTIYLIGCDHFYDKDREGRIAHTDAANHFHPDYRKPGEIVNGAPIERMETGYRRMRDLAEANGSRIINISRQTGLTIFERGTVESVFEAV